MSSRPRVYLTREIPAAALARLREETELEVNPADRAVERRELLEGVAGKQGLLCLVTDAVDDEVLAAGPGLEVIANMAVGYDNVDVAAATRRGVLVTNTPGVLTETTADLAFALILGCARRLIEGDRLVRAGRWQGWGPLQLLGADVHGATLGVVGFGRIGRALVPRAHGFGMQVLYWNRNRLAETDEQALGVRYAGREELLREADFVSLHLAYRPETHHTIGDPELATMKPSAYLVNTSRGAVVNEAALVSALRRRTIAGAGLDVYEREPALQPGLVELDNVILLPHLGSASFATRERMGTIAVDNLLRACRGERPPNLVNPEVWERRTAKR